jgi:hypothetical protein
VNANEGLESCARCGFSVNFAGASPKGVAKLRIVMDDHLAACPTLPTWQERRDLKRALSKPWVKRDPALTLQIAEDHLARIGGARGD